MRIHITKKNLMPLAAPFDAVPIIAHSSHRSPFLEFSTNVPSDRGVTGMASAFRSGTRPATRLLITSHKGGYPINIPFICDT